MSHKIFFFNIIKSSYILLVITLWTETLTLNPPELTEYHPRHDRHKSTPAPGIVTLRNMITDFNSSDQMVFCISGCAKNLTAATNLHMVTPWRTAHLRFCQHTHPVVRMENETKAEKKLYTTLLYLDVIIYVNNYVSVTL